MGRRARIELPDAIYHVIQRGNNKEFIFNSSSSKKLLLNILEEAMQEIPYQLLGYAIMDNHYHLMIKRGNAELGRIMQKVNNRYSKIYNKLHERTGHVFEGRYRSILVGDDRYLLSLLQYIHQNPVEVKICKSVEEYPWSSDKYYRNNKPGLVNIDFILNILSSDRKTALKQYCVLMEKYDPLDSAFFEGCEIIKDESQPAITARITEKPALDQILLSTGLNDADFQLVKSGSRMRYLMKYKIDYVKSAREYGYTYKEIGENIKLSAGAISKIRCLSPYSHT